MGAQRARLGGATPGLAVGVRAGFAGGLLAGALLRRHGVGCRRGREGGRAELRDHGGCAAGCAAVAIRGGVDESVLSRTAAVKDLSNSHVGSSTRGTVQS